MPDFALNADIHLHRTRALVLGREQGDWKAHIASQKVPHKVWVRSFEIEWVERLVQLLEGDQPGSCIADGDIGATELLVNLKCLSTVDGNGLRLALGVTGVNHLVEGARAQPQRTIKQDVIVDHVLVKQPDTTANHSLAIAPRVPGKANLRSKVLVRLSYRVSIPGVGGIDFRDRRQIAVGPTGIAVPAQARIQRKVVLNLPGVSHVETDSVIRAQTTRGKTY